MLCRCSVVRSHFRGYRVSQGIPSCHYADQPVAELTSMRGGSFLGGTASDSFLDPETAEGPGRECDGLLPPARHSAPKRSEAIRSPVQRQRMHARLHLSPELQTCLVRFARRV